MGTEAVVTVRRLKRNAFALVLGFIFICASAALASVPPNFSGGSGTPESPYYISSSEDLSALAQRVMRRQSHHGLAYRSAHYFQTADIDLGGIPAWVPIGLPRLEKTHRSFRGVYDGRGHTIANVHYQWYRHPYTIYPYTTSGDVAEDQYYGLFGVVAGDGEKSGIVRNVRVKTRSLYSEIPNKRVFFGMIAGALWGGKIEGCSVVGGCASIVAVAGNNYRMKDRYYRIGGIVGEVDTGRIENCLNGLDLYSVIEDTYLYMGGIVGMLMKGRVTSCVNKGRIHAVGGMGGGIVGLSWGGGIESSVNLADVETYSSVSSTLSGGIYAGGWSDVLQCVNEGRIAAIARGGFGCAGGLVGSMSDNVLESSQNRGNVYVEARREAPRSGRMAKASRYYTPREIRARAYGGGLVGEMNGGRLRNSANMGDVSGVLEAEGISSDIFLGGIAGYCVSELNCDLLLENALNVGSVTIEKMPIDANDAMGGIVGHWIEDPKKARVLGCYWLWDGQGEAHGVGAGLSSADTATTPLNAEAMRRRESFAGWDFEKIWRGPEGGMIAPEPASLPRRSFEYER